MLQKNYSLGLKFHKLSASSKQLKVIIKTAFFCFSHSLPRLSTLCIGCNTPPYLPSLLSTYHQPDQHLPLKNCTIEKNLVKDYNILYIHPQNKTGFKLLPTDHKLFTLYSYLLKVISHTTIFLF